MTQGAVDTAFAWNTNITNVEKLEIYTQANALNPDTYSTLEVNGEDKSADLVSGNGWNTISNPPATLTSINTNYASTNERIDVYGIRVNGRLLVDQSVWDNSQNWSGGDVTGGGPLNLPWSNAFDGDLSTRPNVSSGTSTLTFTTPLDINGKTVEIYAQGGTTGAGKLTFNGKEWSGGGITSNQWIDITSVFAGDTTFDSITLDFESNPAYLWAIRVDGAVLVDAGDQYNTSQVWSETFTATNPPSGNDPSKTFNGIFELNNGSGPKVQPGGTETASLTGVTLSNSTVTVYLNKGNPATTIGAIVTAGDKTSASTNVDGSALTEITLTGCNGSQIDFSFTDTGNAQAGDVFVVGMKVDGKPLVDAYGPGFGKAGFYLPFDPAQTGENYSSRIATRTGDVSIPETMFNGDLTRGFGNGDNSNNNLATITFDPVFKAGEKIRVYASGNNNCPVTINGSQLINQSSPNAGAPGWYDVEEAYPQFPVGSTAVRSRQFKGLCD